jgi:hypothetical protein
LPALILVAVSNYGNSGGGCGVGCSGAGSGGVNGGRNVIMVMGKEGRSENGICIGIGREGRHFYR